MIAAYAQRNPDYASRIDFANQQAEGYASNIGLVEVLAGNYQFPQRGGLQGYTYTKLTRLSENWEIEACNTIISDLLFAQLADDPNTAQILVKVIGELHDNVASHARGFGFSAAQVYNESAGRYIRFAIADSGCGMLENVRRVGQVIASDGEAIHWCMTKGNTTGKEDDFLAQHLPEDAVFNPYPSGVPTTRVQNHHVGLGLWHLSQLVSNVDGMVSVLSGSGVYRIHRDRSEPIMRESPFHWPGVAIEFEIPVPRDGRSVTARGGDLDQVAKRLGL